MCPSGDIFDKHEKKNSIGTGAQQQRQEVCYG